MRVRFTPALNTRLATNSEFGRNWVDVVATVRRVCG